MEWSDVEARWIIATTRGDTIRARYVTASTGPLHRPKLPGIPGIRDFKGHAFHTSRWDYGYTGGTSSGNLTGLKDQRVALIGTGATGIQVLPHLGRDAAQVHVLQRTPSAVDERNNRPTDIAWFKSQPQGWQRRRMDNFVSILLGIPQEEDLVDDCWTDVWSRLASWKKDEETAPTSPMHLKNAGGDDMLLQLADYEKMEAIRARIGAIVRDPATAEALKPWYNLFCKRPLYSDDYLQTFNLPNVHLVDTQGRGVDRITQNAVVFDGKAYEVDCIVFATGFQVGAYTYEAGGYELVGRGGVTLRDKWANGVQSLHGVQIHGFPNFHIVGTITQASVSVNYPHTTARQAEHAAALIARCLRAGMACCEITREAELKWGEAMAGKAIDRSVFDMECTPSYFTNEGDLSERPSLFGGTYGGGPFEYIDLLENWRRSGFDRDVVVEYRAEH